MSLESTSPRKGQVLKHLIDNCSTNQEELAAGLGISLSRIHVYVSIEVCMQLYPNSLVRQHHEQCDKLGEI